MNIEAKELSKIYGSGESRVVALDKVNLEIASSDFISIMGPSGSGKSTLLHLLSGLDKPTSGSLTYDGKDIYRFNDKELSSFRRRRIGFIFQQFNLLPVLTAKENIIMPLLLDKKQPDEVYLNQLTDLLGIRERLTHLPHELSGGQQQRVAIARALIAKPDIIFADEPTGNLDSKSGGEVMEMLQSIWKKMGKTLVNALSMYPAIGNVKEGRLPEEAIEIALSEDALQYLGLDAVIGDTVSLDLSVSVMDGSLSELEYSADFVLTGILESSYIGYASGTVEGIVGEGTAEELLPEEYLLYSTDFKTYDKQNFQSIIYALAEDLNVDERYIQYNWVLLDAIGISYDEAADSDTGTGFSFMTAACILVGVLVLLAAGLVIYNILKISITKRIKEYGTLRAIGGERGQIYRLVSLQLLILCGAGIPIGLLLGILSAKGVLIAATGLLNPDLFMANSTSELNSAINTASTVKLPMLFASIAVILLFALLAAFPAARYASHVSPTVAMSGQTVKIKRRIKRNRNIRNFEAYYARLNLKRGRGRTAVTILSLVMSITVFVALQSFTGLLDASSSVQDMYFSDYAVTNETVGIPSEAVKTLAENDAVESVSTTRLSVFMPGAGDILPFETDLSVQSHETLQLVNVDEAQLQIYAPNLSAQDKQALKDGTGCLVKNPIAFSYGDTTVQQTDLTVGDTIQLGDRTLPVLGLIDTAITINNDGFTNGVQLIVNDEIYCSLLGNDSYSEVYPTLQDNADTDTFESWLDSWCSNYPGTHWLSYLQSSNEMIESFEQIKMLCWVLIIFIGIIGILNIINTVYSNIHTRVGEIGMQRAIGMSAASLYKTFLWEGAYYGIIASVIGAVFGYVCCIFVGAAQTDALQLVAVPVMAIVEAAIISIVACLLATAIPLRSIARMSIVDSIETVE